MQSGFPLSAVVLEWFDLGGGGPTGHLEAPREPGKRKRQLKGRGNHGDGGSPYVMPTAEKASRIIRIVSVLPLTDAWPLCSSAFSRMADDMAPASLEPSRLPSSTVLARLLCRGSSPRERCSPQWDPPECRTSRV